MYTYPPSNGVLRWSGGISHNHLALQGGFLFVARITAASSLLLSAQWSVAIKIKPAILHPATLYSSIRSPPLWLKLPALSAETPDNPGNPTTHISNGSPTVICGNCPAIWLTDHRPPTIDHPPWAWDT